MFFTFESFDSHKWSKSSPMNPKFVSGNHGLPRVHLESATTSLKETVSFGESSEIKRQKWIIFIPPRGEHAISKSTLEIGELSNFNCTFTQRLYHHGIECHSSRTCVAKAHSSRLLSRSLLWASDWKPHQRIYNSPVEESRKQVRRGSSGGNTQPSVELTQTATSNVNSNSRNKSIAPFLSNLGFFYDARSDAPTVDSIT